MTTETYWQKGNQLFSEKSFLKESISLTQKDKIVADSADMAETLINYSVTLCKMWILLMTQITKQFLQILQPQFWRSYKNPNAILGFWELKKNMKNNNMSFSFKFVTDERVIKEINNLNPRKANQDNYIPTKIIKESKIIFSHFLYHNVDNFLQFLFFHLAWKSRHTHYS